MSTAKKTNGEPAPAATQKTEVVETIATLYTKGVERLAEVQKKGIDLAVKQNAELLDAWKTMAKVVPSTPGLFMLDLASSALERFADTQKSAIDLVLEQSHALAGIARDGAKSAAKATEDAAAVVQQTVEQSVAAQKKALDNSVVETKAAFESARKKFGITGTQADEAARDFQRGVDTLIETQKELLDIAAKPFTSVH